MTVAPQGTPLWHPQKDDFAPRLGIAWQARPNLVLRAGAGIFYDLGYCGRGGRLRRMAVRSAKDIYECAISAERRRRRSAPLFHDAAGRVIWQS